MEQTVDTLEAMFQKANSDLNYLSRKIEFEFEQGNQENKGNPVKMLQKITDIKKEYANLVKEVAAIQEAQKEAVDFIKTQLVTLCELVQKAAEKSQEEVSLSCYNRSIVIGVKKSLDEVSQSCYNRSIVIGVKKSQDEVSQSCYNRSIVIGVKKSQDKVSHSYYNRSVVIGLKKSQEKDGKKPEEMDKLVEILGIKLPPGLNESTASAVTDNSEPGTSDIDDNTFTLG
ncbi:hypothetical protein KUTeg_009763 [Tegillarca granosa]|uniref:Protein FAM33A n=1 Tax=Tegillarca granosa TaxID=220873 RepID=A0ABQ9F9X2_TEGGR|nr:hypothetical protein KUTeg_009763 [Tegillarca granosa]